LKTILVIEGDAMVRRFLRSALEAAGYWVSDVSNDAEGLAIAARGGVALIVIDCMGTHAGGLRTLQTLRNNTTTALIPVIAMSGLGQYGYDLPFWANACLVKPFRPAQLIRKIEALLPEDSRVPVRQDELLPALGVAAL